MVSDTYMRLLPKVIPGMAIRKGAIRPLLLDTMSAPEVLHLVQGIQIKQVKSCKASNAVTSEIFRLQVISDKPSCKTFHETQI